MSVKQLTAWFVGHVQGVGFRYTVDRIAGHFEVTGYVRNLPDGRVEMMAEGDESQLKDLLQAVRDSPMSRNIRHVEVLWQPAEHRFDSFGIAT